ncbi:MAG TPA: hypothetical protein GXX36_09780 [Clostridiaceae bacterium]|nr:hypothetical protein [Clostridiaceae bacterium]
MDVDENGNIYFVHNCKILVYMAYMAHHQELYGVSRTAGRVCVLNNYMVATGLFVDSNGELYYLTGFSSKTPEKNTVLTGILGSEFMDWDTEEATIDNVTGFDSSAPAEEALPMLPVQAQSSPCLPVMSQLLLNLPTLLRKNNFIISTLLKNQRVE